MKNEVTENHINSMIPDFEEIEDRKTKKNSKKNSQIGATVENVPNIFEVEEKIETINISVRIECRVEETLKDILHKSNIANRQNIKLGPYCAQVLKLFSEGKLTLKQ